jgi:hypothetical protein
LVLSPLAGPGAKARVGRGRCLGENPGSATDRLCPALTSETLSWRDAGRDLAERWFFLGTGVKANPIACGGGSVAAGTAARFYLGAARSKDEDHFL